MSQHKVSRKRRLALFEEQFGRCCYCGCRMTVKPKYRLRDDYATADHVEPQSIEVRPNPDRVIVVACLRCNLMKADTPLIVFLAKLARMKDEVETGRPYEGRPAFLLVGRRPGAGSLPVAFRSSCTRFSRSWRITLVERGPSFTVGITPLAARS